MGWCHSLLWSEIPFGDSSFLVFFRCLLLNVWRFTASDARDRTKRSATLSIVWKRKVSKPRFCAVAEMAFAHSFRPPSPFPELCCIGSLCSTVLMRRCLKQWALPVSASGVSPADELAAKPFEFLQAPIEKSSLGMKAIGASGTTQQRHLPFCCLQTNCKA